MLSDSVTEYRCSEGAQLVIALGIDDDVIVRIGTFLLDIIAKHAGVIGKDIVVCKLRLADGNEALAILHIMHTIDGDTPCLDEGGTEGRLVHHGITVFHETLAHDVRFQWKVSTQTAVTPADDDEAIAIVLVHLDDHLHSLTRHLLSILSRHSARIRQYVEEGLSVRKPFAHAVFVPLRDEQTTMNGLNARRVVIKNDHLPSHLFHLTSYLLPLTSHLLMCCISLASSGVAGSQPIMRISATSFSTNSALVCARLPGA